MVKLEIRKLTSEADVRMAVELAKFVYNNAIRCCLTNTEEAELFDGYMVADNIVNDVANGQLDMWGVCDGPQILGVSAMTNTGHMTMLYIHQYIIRQGWGRKLVHTMRVFGKSEYNLDYITANATPAWTSNILKKMGFTDVSNGIYTQPAAYIPLHAKTIKEITYEKRTLSTAFVVAWTCGISGILFVGSILLLWITYLK